jgi:hypothetical protein
MFRPSLQDCVLEDRLLPVISNLGMIVLTTGGYVLMIPFPGASVYPGGSPGGSVTSGVSGTLIPTSFSIAGSGGISSLQPGNLTGVANLGAAGTTGASGVAGAAIAVGSGANDATAPSTALVTRNTVAFDTPILPPLIGRLSGDHSPVLPVGQIYRGGIPMTAPAPAPSGPQGQPASSPLGARSVSPSPIPRDGAPLRIPSDASSKLPKTLADAVP